jgi:hypothetical protein
LAILISNWFVYGNYAEWILPNLREQGQTIKPNHPTLFERRRGLALLLGGQTMPGTEKISQTQRRRAKHRNDCQSDPDGLRALRHNGKFEFFHGVGLRYSSNASRSSRARSIFQSAWRRI